MPGFLDWADASKYSPEIRTALLRAQSEAFTKQIPLLYFVLCVDAASLSFTFDGVAPWQLSILFPSLLIIACAIRMVVWLRRRSDNVGIDALHRRFQATTALGAVLGVLFVGWTLTLYQYGDAALRGQVAGTFGITAICCIYCLLHFPRAALILAATAVPVFSLFLATSQSLPMTVFGMSLLVATAGMMYMVVRAANDFTAMVVAQVKAQRLSDLNSRLANVDSLTELPNRRQFFERLHDACERYRRSGRFYVGILDLDGFKPVNDVFGHTVGDRVLVECAARFRAALGGRHFIARLGGDEFGLIVEGVDTDAGILALGDQVCAATREPFAYEDAIATISTSIGFAACPEAGETPRQIYERADYALYYAKQRRRGRPVLFTPEHEDQMKGVAVLEQTLRRADLDKELYLEFQPLYDVADGSIVSFEALARWINPEVGPVAPDKFIAIAERSDMIYPTSRALLRKALAAAAAWPDHMQLSFNLSARDLISPSSIAQIIAIIESSPVAASRIDLEITETALMTDFERAREAILRLKGIGVKISLDDFGTGYSSLSYVHRLPLDRIKIDRSFVQEMETSDLARDLVRTMIAMCRSLNMHCVIEGVETEAQLALLKSYGCNMAQGYLFSKPLPQSEVVGFIAAASRRAILRDGLLKSA